MYKKNELLEMLVFDIETVSKTSSLDLLPANEKEIWLFRYHQKYAELAERETEKLKYSGRPICFDYNNQNDVYLKYAPLVPEFSKVIAAAVGKFNPDYSMTTDSFSSENEVEVLNWVTTIFDHKNFTSDILSGFNISAFDIPFLIKRMLLNRLPLPKKLQLKGKKPWEVRLHDLFIDWKGLSYDMVAFETLTTVLGLGSSKGEVSEVDLGLNYYSNRIGLEEIKKYVTDDVNKNMESFLALAY